MPVEGEDRPDPQLPDGYHSPSILAVLRAVGRRLVPQIVEGTLIPTVLFTTLLAVSGITAALVGALGWSYVAVGRRLVVRRAVPPLVLLGSLGITARTAVTIAAGNPVIYFVQPVLGTTLVGLFFLGSVAIGRPIVARFGDDFCPLPADIAARPGVRSLFRRLTYVWAFVNLAAATTTGVLLAALPLPVFVVARALAAWTITTLGVVTTVVLAVRAGRREDLVARVTPGGRLTALARVGAAPA